MSISFKDSKDYSLGVEIEAQLVDRETLGLVSTSKEIIGSLPGYASSIKHELMQSNIEINTKVCADIKEAEEDLYSKFNVLIKEASKFDTILCCAGSHPFSLWKDQTITEDERYKRLLDRLQGIARHFNVFGLHVHVGIGDGEKCIYIINRMLYYLPHFLALSANSPFWEGENTGLKSYRIKIFETLPTAGLPFYFNDWADYTKLVNNYIATDTIESIREIWWDVRPHHDFGTVEVRICDSPSSVRETLGIATLIQALVAKLGKDYENNISFKNPHASVIRENKWRASRYGLDGEFLTEDGGRTISIKESISKLMAMVEAEAERLGSREYLSIVEDMLDSGDSAMMQVKEWERSGDMREVVRYLSEKLAEDVEKGIISRALGR